MNILRNRKRSKSRRYTIGEVAVEFMESTAPDGEVAKFIDTRGEGAFLISYKVDDLSKAMEELKDKNVKLIDHQTQRALRDPICLRTPSQ